MMMCRRGLMMAGGGLPGTYRGVEYLESSGTQYMTPAPEPEPVKPVEEETTEPIE